VLATRQASQDCIKHTIKILRNCFSKKSQHNPGSTLVSSVNLWDLWKVVRGDQRLRHRARVCEDGSVSSLSMCLSLELNPLLRGWGEYYKRAHVRKLFQQRLDGWVRRRIWSHRYKRWRSAGWKRLPVTQLYGEYELVRLIDLIPSLASRRH
jgi:Group II intron, maturase-specific domain